MHSWRSYIWHCWDVLKRGAAIITFQQPCSGFSASDLAALEQMWPNGEHKSDSQGDHLVVRRPGERSSWLSIVRHRDGTYLSLNSSGAIYAQGKSLADLALDGV